MSLDLIQLKKDGGCPQASSPFVRDLDEVKEVATGLATSKMVAEAHDDDDEQASGSGELLELDNCSGSSLISGMLHPSVNPSLLLSSSSSSFLWEYGMGDD